MKSDWMQSNSFGIYCNSLDLWVIWSHFCIVQWSLWPALKWTGKKFWAWHPTCVFQEFFHLLTSRGTVSRILVCANMSQLFHIRALQNNKQVRKRFIFEDISAQLHCQSRRSIYKIHLQLSFQSAIHLHSCSGSSQLHTWNGRWLEGSHSGLAHDECSVSLVICALQK